MLCARRAPRPPLRRDSLGIHQDIARGSIMRFRLVLAICLTVAYAGAMLKLATYRNRHGIFEVSWDWFNPANYEPGARRWMGAARVLFVGLVLAWISVLSG